MPFRKKTRNTVSRPEKENERIDAIQPLSPRLIRCKSDNTHRTCSEISLNKPSSNNDNLSPEAKMSNLMQLNTALVKEIASLRHSHADSCDKFSKLESSLRAENGKLALELSSLQEEASALKEENAALLASQEELQFSLGTSRAQVDGLSMELAMVKVEVIEALSSQKQALVTSEECLASATYDLIAAKEKAALVSSEKDSAFEEKEVALRSKAETEDRMEALEDELAKLLQVERKTMANAQEVVAALRAEVEKLLAEKEDNNVKRAARENEVSQKMELLEENLNVHTTKVNSLTLQIEQERALHAQAMKTRQENSDRENSELSAEIKAGKRNLQESRNTVKTLSMQKERDWNDHQAETTTLTEKLMDSSQKSRAMEKLLQESNASVEELRKQLVVVSAKHQLEVISLQEKGSAIAVEVSSLSEENQKLQAKKENLHKELSRVNEKYRATSEQLVRERKTLSEAQLSAQVLQQEVTQLRVDKEKSLHEVDQLKQEISQCDMIKTADQKAYAEERQKLLTQLKEVEGTVSDLEIEQSDLLTQLNVEKMAVAAAEEKIGALESSKEALLRENFNIKVAQKELLGSLEREVASLHDEEQRLYQVNVMLHEQVASILLERDDALVEKDGVKAKLVELEVELLQLGSAKNAIQQTLKDERALAQSTMSSSQHEIECLQQSNHQLIHEFNSARSRAEAVAEDNKQLSMSLALVQSEKAQLELRLSNLREDLVHVGKRLEVASMVLAKQQTDLEQLQNENSKLTSEKSQLLNSIKMHENEGKLLMAENDKKTEQIAFLSRLSAELEVSHSALQGEMARQKAAYETLERNNGVLQSSIVTKAKAILVLERQIDDSAKTTTALESQIETISSMHNMLELRVKNLQEETIAQNAALDAEKQEKLFLHSTLQDKNIKLQSLEGQLAEAAKQVSLLVSQLETSNKRHQEELQFTLSAVYEDLAKAEAAATKLKDQAKTDLDCMLSEKNNEVGNLKAQVEEAHQKNSDVIIKLKTCNEEKSMLGAQFKNIEAELATTKGEVLKAEKELMAAAKREGDFNEAFKRVSLLEAQLSAKATMQNELEFQVISLQNDLQAARATSAKAEKEWKAKAEAMRESANARSRTLEEQLESVKKTLDEMQNSASKGQESIASLQTQLACLTEEKSSLEKKVSLHPRLLEVDEPYHEEEPVEDMAAQRRLNEKAKLVRLALPVFLISAASSVVIAGIQSYLKNLEN